METLCRTPRLQSHRRNDRIRQISSLSPFRSACQLLESDPPGNLRSMSLAIREAVVDVGERTASATIASALCRRIAFEPVRRPICFLQMAELVEAAFLERCCQNNVPCACPHNGQTYAVSECFLRAGQ